MLKEISIEVIRKCPNRCLHCSSFSTSDCNEIIPLGKFKEIINNSKTLGLRTVCFSGGEPFLHPNIEDMIEYVYSLGLNSYIYSSGIYMNSDGMRTEIPDKILDNIEGKVTKIIFNIEAANESVYDRIMGSTGCFGYMKESIKNSVNKGILVEGHFVPMRLNFNQIEAVLKLCKDLNVSKLSFLRLVIHGRALENKEELMLSEEELKEVEILLKKIYEKNTDAIRIGVPIQGETKESHCEAAIGKLNIKYDGGVYPCEVFKNNRIVTLDNKTVGNIFNENIRIIYHESEYLKTVREMIEQFSYSNCCENCAGQYYMKLPGEIKNYGQ